MAINYDEKTVKELRSICASLNLTRYSKAPKPVLIDMINEYYAASNNSIAADMEEKYTANELRKMCAEKGITGVSKKPKKVLVELLLAEETDDNEEEELDISSISTVQEEETEKEKETEKGNIITVVNGARSRKIPLNDGDTPWDIHERMCNEMGIDTHPSFQVNDINVSNKYILQGGDILEFFKVNGSKGNDI